METVLESVTAEQLQAIVLSEALQANGIFQGEPTTFTIYNRGSGSGRHFYIKINRPVGANA